MRGMGAWGVAAALIVGLGVAAATADETDGDAKAAAAKSNWWGNWFGDKPKEKPKDDKKTPAAAEPPPSPSGTMAVSEQQRQMNAYLRRVQVCLRLREVALETNNADLQRQADVMEARAWEIYGRKTAHLPLPAPAPEAGITTNANKPADPRGRPIEDFDQPERNLINGPFMGRDKP